MSVCMLVFCFQLTNGTNTACWILQNRCALTGGGACALTGSHSLP